MWIRYWDQSKYIKEVYNVTPFGAAYITEEEEVVEEIEEGIIKEKKN